MPFERQRTDVLWRPAPRAAIAAYCKRHPLVQISLDLNDRLVDVVADGYDMVIRIARDIAPCRQVLCALPDYLNTSTFGILKVPQDLTRHRCLCYTNEPNENVWT